MRGTFYARILSFGILAALHNALPEAPRTFVDDLAELHIGSEAEVLQAAKVTTLAVSSCLRRMRMHSSPKYVLAGSRIELAAKAAVAIRKGTGVKYKVERRATDLGLDCGGMRRIGVKHKKRNNKARARAVRIGKLTKWCKEARKLYISGARPQVSYGETGYGVAQGQVTRARQTANTATRAGAAACLTSTLALHYGPSRDPAVAIPVEQLRMWQQL